VAYTVVGGLRKVYVTDSIQLGVSYLGFAVAIAYLLPSAFGASGGDGLIVSLLAAAVYGILLVEELRREPGGVKSVFLILSVLLLSGSVLYSLQGPATGWFESNVPGPWTQLSEDYGWVTLLGFTLLNLLWQFCDSSGFQRIRSLSITPDDAEQSTETIRKSVRATILTSPVTWGLGILLGIAVKAAGIVPSGGESEYVAFIHALHERESVLATLALGAVAASIAAIMLSTVDSSLISALQLAMSDIFRVSSLHRPLLALAGAAVVLLLLGFAFLHRQLDYSPQATPNTGPSRRPATRRSLFPCMEAWKGIDFDEEFLRVTKKPPKFSPTSHEKRVLPLNAEILSHLQEIREKHPDAEWVCLNCELRQWSLGLTKWTRELFEAAEINRSHATLHRLRHTFGTNLLHAGVDIETVRDLMGHADITTTARYLSTTDPRRRAAVGTLT